MRTQLLRRRSFLSILRQLYSLTRSNGTYTILGPLSPPSSLQSAVLHLPANTSSSLPSKSLLASLAALAVGAVVSFSPSPALAEANTSPWAPSGPLSDDNNEQVDDATVHKALHDLWQRIEEQLHRLDASQPQGQSLPRIPEPEIQISNGQVDVAFQVPRQLNITGATSELRRQLNNPSRRSSSGGLMAASTSETSSSGPKGTARRLRRSSQNPLNSVTVDILEPFDPEDLVRFEFKGACTAANLNLLASVMLTAAQPRQRGSPGLARRNSSVPGWFGNLGDEELEAGLEEFFGPLRDLMHEFERLHSEHQHTWGGIFEGGSDGGMERDTLPTPLRRPPKRFDDFGPPQDYHPSKSSAAGGIGRQTEAAIRKLRDMGCQVFLPAAMSENDNGSANESATTTTSAGASTSVDWGQLAGYDDQKRAIEDCLLLPLVRPDVYDNVARGTREKFAPNRPRAVLFVGPPGTGKTTSARVIATQAAVPLVYIPLEALVSKWYGESEQKLAGALEAADSLPDGCIVFLDELDALATTRGGEMHEATRRLLGVLLRHMDGFDANKRSVVVGATNRPQDLDPALISRFSATVEFGLPDEVCRAQILKQYAHHLKNSELLALANATPGMAGRDLRDVCEQAERRWAARIIRKQAPEGGLPPLQEYIDAANARLKEMASASGRLKMPLMLKSPLVP